MLKLIFLLLVPGFFTEFIVKNNKIKCKESLGKRIMNGLLYSYFIFLINISVLVIFFNAQYEDLLFFLSDRMRTINDLSLFTLMLFVQLLIAYSVAIINRIIRYKSIEKTFSTMTLMQKNYATGAIFLSLTVALVAFVVKDNAEQSLVINEVCSKNDSVIKDENDNYSDYIELYNPSKWSVSLKGFLLSNQSNLKKNKELENVVIPAKGYYVVWLNDSDDTTSMRISSKGESIYLANSEGKVIDMVTVPELKRNISYARATDGADNWQEEKASPAQENNPLRKHLNAPVFSAESGFYEDEFLLSIKADEGQNIYYTLDSSIPDQNANLYTDKILVKNVCKEPNVHIGRRNVVKDWDTYNPQYGLVDKVFVVRAVAVDDFGNTSDVVSKTYLVDMEQYKDSNVVSLVADPDDLFGEDGIYVTGWKYDEWYAGDRGPADILVNFLKKGREYEIPGQLIMLNNDVIMNQSVGLRIQGGSTRENPSKRFAIYARKEYSGDRYFEYDLFGRDTHAMFTRGDFADTFLHSLVTDRNVATQRAVSIKMFLAGEFWYDTALREKYNEDFLSTVYGVPRDKVVIYESVPRDVLNFLEVHDLSNDEDYLQFCELIDVQSYIDYMAINIYICNMDMTENKNYKVWRTTEKTQDDYGDGRIRWLLYDVDCLGWYGAECYKIDSFTEIGRNLQIAMNQHTVYKELKENRDFCKKFVLTFMDLANYNFVYQNVAEQLEKNEGNMSFYHEFFEKRFDVIVPAMAKEFGLQGTLEEITLCVNNQTAGYVQINTITPELTDGSWKGSYYTDYPVTITAIANDGYTFVGWKCGEEMIKDTQIEVQLTEGGCQWEAVFE